MKTNAIIMMCTLMLRLFTGCAAQPESSGTPGVTSGTTGFESPAASDPTDNEPSAEPEVQPGNSETSERHAKMMVNGQEVLITLYDTPTANALYEALPMELSFSDYNGTEKIAYPPEELPTDGEPDGCDPDIGDLCLYAPWGNLCVFYQDFHYSVSLIKLGRVEIGLDALSRMSGDFKVTLEQTD